MTRQDEIALGAKRKSTLKSLKAKKATRIKQIRSKAEADIREVNILYAEDPERLRAKYAADEYAKNERTRLRAEKKIETEKKLIAQNSQKRAFTLAEKIFNAIVQGCGAVAAIVATVLLIVQAATNSPLTLRAYFVTSYALVCASLVVMYIMSCLHHALISPGAKDVFSRLSHAFAFMAIGSGYTAILLTAMNNVTGWVLFGIVWGIAVLGIIFYSVFGDRIEKFSIALYILLGWSGIFVFGRLSELLPPISFRLLIITGIIYTISIPFYLLRKIKFAHSVGNLIMLFASGCLYLSLLFQLKL